VPELVPEPVPTPEELNVRLRSAWPVMTWRPTGEAPRTIVVMHSIAVYVTPHWLPLMPAFEERYLCFLLGLASPGTRIVYVTSMPIHPRLIDYWLGLVPGLDTAHARSRLTLVPVVDARPVTLTRKVLDHPGTIRRIREAVADPNLAVVVGHTVTEDDIRLSGLLGVPVYGAHPTFAHWGTKTGSREAFDASGVPVVPGVSGIWSRDDVASAIKQLREADPGLARVIVKHDDGVSGIGNGTIDLRDRPDIVDPLDTIVLEDKDFTATAYYERLAQVGGVVEAFLAAEEVRSPSAQLRLSPDGESEVLATHEQVLGGPNGLTYLGCTMPAEPEYAVQVGLLAEQVGKFLAGKGVVGRCSIDFLAARTGERWTAYGSEINLRNGGTTHPLSTLSSLTAGGYDMDTAIYQAADGTPKYYRATDHLQGHNYGALTTDDLLDVLEPHDLGWDHATGRGTVFHLASAIGGNGVVGLTAIEDSPAAALAQFRRSRAALDLAAARLR
jgi:hypothetical protein